MTPIPPRRCPTNHRHVEEDGVRIEKERRQDGGTHRRCYVLATCRDCGQRLAQRYDMRRWGNWSVAESLGHDGGYPDVP